MANRYLSQFQYSYQRQPVHAWAKITFGATGAPTLAANPLFSSVTRNSTGTYTFVLRDVFNSFLGVKHVFNSGSSAPAAPGMYIKADNSTNATKTIQIVFNAAGTAADPASGEIVYLHFEWNNSSVTI